MASHLLRCLELHPNNLQALMALAVSLTNTGMRQEACEALHSWICHNPRYKHLARRSPKPPRSPRASSVTRYVPLLPERRGHNRTTLQVLSRRLTAYL